MDINGISITFHTEKIKECVEFYKKYFQAVVTFDADWYVTIRLKNNLNIPIYISFQGPCEEAIENDFKGGVTLNMLTDDVDACYEQIKQTGISFVETITDHEWGDRAFSVQDPIGNVLYVFSEREIDDKYKNAIKE